MGRTCCNDDRGRRKKKALTFTSAGKTGAGSRFNSENLQESDPLSAPGPVLPVQEADSAAANADWPGWRGLNRDGRVVWLPDSLPDAVDFDWIAELTGEGLGGIAAAEGYVIVGSRDVLDRSDVFQCFSMEDGSQIWQHAYPALGKLDYGNAPRATPLIHGEYVYTLGAFGHLCCLEIETGILMWQANLVLDFGAPNLIWGHAGSPLLVDNKLILQPGGKEASIVALDAESGDVIWSTPGIDPGYSSLLLKQVGDSQQVIGCDSQSLGGWDVKTGKRLWTLVPPQKGDFNVPTVVSLGERLLVASENNGTRLYHFNRDGTLQPKPDAQNEDLKPDSHTPVVSNGRVFGIWTELYGLAPEQNLETVIIISDNAFAGYGCLIASDARLLAMNDEGELLLIATDQNPASIISRLRLRKERTQVLSHPAVAGNALYVRIGTTLARLNLRP